MDKARLRFQNALYGKFFGKPPPFEQVKKILTTLWSNVGEVLISDLPNGYLLLRCASQDVMHKILFEGPWTVNGIILQLAQWQPFFEPVFTKLTTAAVWVQLHNLPVEFWEAESLEKISTCLGRLLKVDDFTGSLARSKFARVCVELDLAKPLKQGFWLGDDCHRVFVVVLYERLPTFCYVCGVIGHGTNTCSRRNLDNQSSPSPPLCSDPGDGQRPTVMEEQGLPSIDREVGIGSRPPEFEQALDRKDEASENDFGPWMLVTRRRGRGGGRGGAGGSGNLEPRETHANPRTPVGENPNISAARSEVGRSPRGGRFRGRGGHASPRPRVSDGSGPNAPSVPSGKSPHANHDSEPMGMAPSAFLGAEVGGLSDTFHCPKEATGSIAIGKESNVEGSLASNLRSSVGPGLLSEMGESSVAHLRTVDRIADLLQPPNMHQRNPSMEMSESDEMSGSESEDDEENEEESEIEEGEEVVEAEDHMTLDQYQTGIRKENLIRRVPLEASSSFKKGRLEKGVMGA